MTIMEILLVNFAYLWILNNMHFFSFSWFLYKNKLVYGNRNFEEKWSLQVKVNLSYEKSVVFSAGTLLTCLGKLFKQLQAVA